MLASMKGAGHLANEEDGERAVALERAADPGDALTAESLDP